VDWLDDPRDGHGAAAGNIVTIFRQGYTVVWLIGEIDLAVDADLSRLAVECPRSGGHVVVDTAHVTFCDGTLSRFVSQVVASTPVTVRRPTRLVLDVLKVTGLRPSVKLDDPA
jgi:hypothetical protein